MQDPLSALTLALPALVQEGQDLPTSVPGVGPATDAGATQADGSATGGTTGGGNTQASPTLFNPIFGILILFMLFMVVSTMMSARKEKRRAAEMMASLKRGDKVLTAGGMIGTIHEVREDSIVLRVDDVSGAKAHFTRGAIQKVIKPSKQDGKAEPEVAQAG